MESHTIVFKCHIRFHLSKVYTTVPYFFLFFYHFSFISICMGTFGLAHQWSEMQTNKPSLQHFPCRKVGCSAPVAASAKQPGIQFLNALSHYLVQSLSKSECWVFFCGFSSKIKGFQGGCYKTLAMPCWNSALKN